MHFGIFVTTNMKQLSAFGIESVKAFGLCIVAARHMHIECYRDFQQKTPSKLVKWIENGKRSQIAYARKCVGVQTFNAMLRWNLHI